MRQVGGAGERAGGRDADAVPARVAVYYAPRPDDPLFAAGATWLGRDPESDAPAPQPDLPDIVEITAEPRLYGFHATLKPPMRLARGPAVVRRGGGGARAGRPHRCVRPAAPGGAGPARLSGLARDGSVPAAASVGRCVRGTSRSVPRARRPTPSWHDAAAPADRRAGCDADALGVSLRVRHMVLPHDADAAADGEEKARLQPAAEAYFARALSVPRRVADICLFVQAAPERAASLLPSGFRCAVERGQEARCADLAPSRRSSRSRRGTPSGNATLRASRAAMSAALSRPRAARRAASTPAAR